MFLFEIQRQKERSYLTMQGRRVLDIKTDSWVAIGKVSWKDSTEVKYMELYPPTHNNLPSPKRHYKNMRVPHNQPLQITGQHVITCGAAFNIPTHTHVLSGLPIGQLIWTVSSPVTYTDKWWSFATSIRVLMKSSLSSDTTINWINAEMTDNLNY